MDFLGNIGIFSCGDIEVLLDQTLSLENNLFHEKMDVSVEVRTATNEAKKLVLACKTSHELSDVILKFVHLLDISPTSNEREYGSQKEPIQGNGTLSSSGIHAYSAEFKKEFLSRQYGNFCEHVLRHSDPSFLKDDNFKKMLSRLFIQGPADLSFLALVSAFASLTHTDKLNFTISVLDDFVTRSKFTELFMLQCLGNTKKHLWQDLLTVVSSLPDKLANKMKLALSGRFHPNLYYKTLGGEIIKTLIEIHKLACKTSNYSTSFLSSLIGKIALRGSTATLFDVLLPQLKEWCYRSPLWSNVCSKMLTEVPESALEPVIECLLKKIAFYPFFSKIMRDNVLTNSFIKHLITHKFLLVRFYKEPNILQNIVGYLCAETRRHVLVDVLKMMLEQWAKSNAIKHMPYEQHFYLTQVIILATVQMNESEIFEHKNVILHKMLTGVQAHLENPNHKIRQIGMVVAECITARLHPDTQKLKFEIADDGDVEKLRSLASMPAFGSAVEKENFLAKKNVIVDNDLDEKLANDSHSSFDGKTQLNDHTEDSDDDLQPYEMSEGDDDLVEGIRPPKYISQCIDGLLSNDDPKRHIASLRVLTKIFKNDGHNLNHQCVQLVTILLHLQDKYSLEDYYELRFSAMVEVTVRCPVEVAGYLTKEFYAQNYSLRQRMDILDVLTRAATELSKPEANSSEIHTENRASLSTSNISEIPETKNWKTIVQERIDKKTRRFSKKASIVPTKVSPNRFANVAGHFFFPLLQGFDSPQNTFDLLGEDCVILGLLVCSLGNIIL